MKIDSPNIVLFIFACSILFLNCSDKEGKSELSEKEPNRMFRTVLPSESGIAFSNTLTENDSLNYFTYSYLYMGGGVATGDINNDGLIDIYFTGNQVPNKLYLNRGDLKFEDISEQAGVQGDDRWYTGVTMGDINADGFLDIYCSVSGKFQTKANQLFVNNGNGTFTEKAVTYGINDIGNSVQGTFFDYDKDGDLDLYVANYPPTKFNSPTFVYSHKMRNVKDDETDHLFRNDGSVFVDVTKESGLLSFGLSLSATVGDLNNDSWPDLYVSNDFNSPDYFYLNNRDGTFNEVVKQATSHTAFYGMGADIADFNNDGNLDIFQVDMDANGNRRKKTNMASMNPTLFWDVVNAGFHYQYMQNCLQMNSGIFENGTPYFLDVSRITGTSSTDWSWGPLFADFDNDGLKDLFITNGTRREVNNNDYFNKLESTKINQDSLLHLSLNIPSEKIDNFIFQNKGNLEFNKANDLWGISYKGFSNGVSYADLDNDGDLELIINNIDDTASIFKNSSSERNNYLTVQCKGDNTNTFGLGNRVYVKVGQATQMQELTLTRGFQSSVAPELHFGLGSFQKIDELRVEWTDGKVQTIKNVAANQTLILKQSNALSQEIEASEKKQLFVNTSGADIFPKFKPKENPYNDFLKQVLLPHKMSEQGPALAVADLNGDGLDDYFVGGSAQESASIFFQTKSGFDTREMSVFDKDRESEDMDALIFDFEGDGDNDIYVVSGGYEFAPDSELLKDRLYINNGTGGFSKVAATVTPQIVVSGSKAYNADFDRDGKDDILVLGRQVPGNYPAPASSYILKNTSNDQYAKFEIFEKMQPKEFKNMGMATAAVITDFNSDGWLDIIVVGEWMPIRVFQNKQGSFKEVSEEMGLNKETTGWWWSIAEGDFDNDGDMDYIIGNNGLNYKYKATKGETFDIYVDDFDQNSSTDIVLSYYDDGEQYPLRGRECSSQQIAGIKQKFETYESFAEATLEDVYSEASLASALHYQVNSFASIYLENKGRKFKRHELPIEAQVSAINKILVDDYNQDGFMDILIAGNLYGSEVETPRNDAGHGLFLSGNGKGNFKVMPAAQSGFFIKGDIKDMEAVRFKNRNFILFARNNDFLTALEVNDQQQEVERIGPNN